MNEIERFNDEKKHEIEALGKDEGMRKLGIDFIIKTAPYKYSYHFTWLGRPIIQFPQDMIAMQEIIWEIKPDLIIETGIAHGGSLIFHASMLELLGKGEVLGIDIEIRPHNKKAIEEHPMFKKIHMIEGSSISTEVINKVKEFARDKKTVLVCLDSYHTKEHVLKELELYSPFVTKGSYIVVFDTIVDDMPDELFKDKPWNQKSNPKKALQEFLKTNKDFVIDKSIQHKLVITVAPDGYLKRIN